MIATDFENCSSCFVYLAQTIDPVASKAVGVASQVAASSAAVVSTALLLTSQGSSASFTSIMTLNSRMALIKYININFPNPLAFFFEYVDFKQFGLPNLFKNILDPGSLDEEAPSVLYNQYWNYTYNVIFFDNCGGIIFTTFQYLALYIIFRIFHKITPAKKEKLKRYLKLIVTNLEMKLLALLVSSRLLQLYFGIILNFRHFAFGNLYQSVSFAFGILYTQLLLGLIAVCIIDLQKRGEGERFKRIEAFAISIKSLCFTYSRSSKVSRFMPLMILFISNLVIIATIALLTNWILLQLIIISIIHILTIALSLFPGLFKKKVEKIQSIVTAAGSLLFCGILAVIHIIDHSAVSELRILAWVAVGTALFIMSFEILMKLVAVYLEWRKTKRLAARKKRRLTAQNKRLEAQNKRLAPITSIQRNFAMQNQPKKMKASAVRGFDQASESMMNHENSFNQSSRALFSDQQFRKRFYPKFPKFRRGGISS